MQYTWQLALVLVPSIFHTQYNYGFIIMATEDDVWVNDDPLHDFGENKEVPSLVAALPQICNDPYALEGSQERFLGTYIPLMF